MDAATIVSAYDWGALGHVVDVGGGDGTLVIALLNEYPALRATVLDVPDTAETARTMLDAAGLSDRGNAVAGDVFGAVPSGAEGYLLSEVLTDHDDEDALRILRTCAAAAGEDAALFVIEDLTAGRRDVPGLTALAERAGLTPVAVHTAGAVAIVELGVA